MIKYFLVIPFFLIWSSTYGALAGGRLNAFSQGENSFAGVVNPANAVWIDDRFDLGAFLLCQKSSFNNRDNNPLFPPGKTDLAYHAKTLFSADAAFHKKFKFKVGSREFESSFSLAIYSLPTNLKLRTKTAFPISGTTPIYLRNKTEVISGVFSLKLNPSHSVGFSIDYYYLSHRRDGFQNSDNFRRSVSPGHVTNNGTDHSSGLGFSIGYRWRITKKLDFGIAWLRKSYCGQFRKYRGYEPHHAENFIPQSVGAGFTYRFNTKLAGRLEMLWVNDGNTPFANNNLLSDGTLNLNKRGSDKSPGPGLQDATYLNLGLGYQFNPTISVGAGYSHRIRLPRGSSLILSHIYITQVIYDLISLGTNLNFRNQNLFLGIVYGLKNRNSGRMPEQLGGGNFTTKKEYASFSASWGYKY